MRAGSGAGAPIAVIGGANVDRKARSARPLVAGTSNPAAMSCRYGGVARNIAETLARLGLPVRLIAAVGADADGRALRAHARAAGIDTSALLALRGVATGSYTALLQPDGQMAIAVNDMAATEQLTPARLLRHGAAWKQTAWRVLDLNLPRDSVELLIDARRDSSVSLVVVAVSEPKMARLPPRLDGIALLLLNAGELAQRAGRDVSTRRALHAACRELQGQGVRELVVTLGAAGALHTRGRDTPQHLPAVPASAEAAAIVDVTGAGDAFAAGVIASLFRHGPDLGGACRLGQRLASSALATLDNVDPALGPALLA